MSKFHARQIRIKICSSAHSHPPQQCHLHAAASMQTHMHVLVIDVNAHLRMYVTGGTRAVTPLEAGTCILVHTNISFPRTPLSCLLQGGTHRRSLGDGTPVTYSAASCLFGLSPSLGFCLSETLSLGVSWSRRPRLGVMPCRVGLCLVLSQSHSFSQPVRACKS